MRHHRLLRRRDGPVPGRQRQTIPMLYAANTSKLVNVMNKLSGDGEQRQWAKKQDIEILEMHDQWKKGRAPSGTSREMGEIMAHALGKENSEDIAVYGRDQGENAPGSQGPSATTPCAPATYPAATPSTSAVLGERLEITHHSYNWECFARGACDCAAYLAGKAPGILYNPGCTESVALHFRQKNTIISLYQLPICRATYMMLGSKEEHSE